MNNLADNLEKICSERPDGTLCLPQHWSLPQDIADQLLEMLASQGNKTLIVFSSLTVCFWAVKKNGPTRMSVEEVFIKARDRIRGVKVFTLFVAKHSALTAQSQD